MESVGIIPVKTMPAAQRKACVEAQLEAGRFWNDCVAFHKKCRPGGKSFPKRKEFHAFTKGKYALHSQTIQQIYQQLIGNVDATLSRRKSRIVLLAQAAVVTSAPATKLGGEFLRCRRTGRGWYP